MTILTKMLRSAIYRTFKAQLKKNSHIVRKGIGFDIKRCKNLHKYTFLIDRIKKIEENRSPLVPLVSKGYRSSCPLAIRSVLSGETKRCFLILFLFYKTIKFPIINFLFPMCILTLTKASFLSVLNLSAQKIRKLALCY